MKAPPPVLKCDHCKGTIKDYMFRTGGMTFCSMHCHTLDDQKKRRPTAATNNDTPSGESK